MNNVNSARALKYHAFLKEKLRPYNQASSLTTRNQSIFKNEPMSPGCKRPSLAVSKKKVTNLHRIFAKVIIKNLQTHSGNLRKYYIQLVNDIIYDEKKHLVCIFKDYLLWDESSDFLKRYYSLSEAAVRIPKISSYYEKYTVMSPVYYKLICNRIMLKNIKRRRKYMERIEENEEQAEKIQKKIISPDINVKKFTQLIKSSMVNCTSISNDDHAKCTFLPTEHQAIDQSSMTLNFNCSNDIEKNTTNMVSQLSINLSQKDKEDSKLLDDLANAICHTEDNYDPKTETIAGSLTNRLKLMSTNYFKNFQPKNANANANANVNVHPPKKIEIKKLDLKNIHNFATEINKKPSECTEPNRLKLKLNSIQFNKLLTQHSGPYTNIHTEVFKTEAALAQAQVMKSSRNINGDTTMKKAELVKKNFNSIESMFKVLSFPSNRQSYTKKITELVKRTNEEGLLAKIKGCLPSKGAASERKKFQLPLKTLTSPLKRRFVPENNPLCKNNPTQKVEVVAQSKSKQKISTPSVGSSVYNINLNLNLNLNLNMQNKHKSDLKAEYESGKEVIAVPDIHINPCENSKSSDIKTPLTERIKSLSKNKNSNNKNKNKYEKLLEKAEKVVIPSFKTGNKHLSRNINDKVFIFNYQSVHTQNNCGFSLKHQQIKNNLNMIPKPVSIYCHSKTNSVSLRPCPINNRNMESNTNTIASGNRSISKKKSEYKAQVKSRNMKRGSINIRKSLLAQNYVGEVSRKYPQTSRNENSDRITLEIMNKLFPK